MFSHRSRINLQPLFYLEKISPFRTLRIPFEQTRSHVPAHKVSLLQRNKVERRRGAICCARVERAGAYWFYWVAPPIYRFANLKGHLLISARRRRQLERKTIYWCGGADKKEHFGIDMAFITHTMTSMYKAAPGPNCVLYTHQANYFSGDNTAAAAVWFCMGWEIRPVRLMADTSHF